MLREFPAAAFQVIRQAVGRVPILCLIPQPVIAQ